MKRIYETLVSEHLQEHRQMAFRRGGDSLMGRFFLYRMHPISIGELSRGRELEGLVGPPRRPAKGALADLLAFGGYPEPFLKASVRFANNWRRLRADALFRNDLRDLTRIQELRRCR